MRLFSDLMRRNSFLDNSGWTVPRRELKENPRLVLEPVDPEDLLALLERMERARFLCEVKVSPLSGR